MEVCCEQPDKVAQSILDPRVPAHNSHPPMPDTSRHQTTSSQAMMDVDSVPRGPTISDKDDYPNQHQYPSPASAPAQPPAPSSTAPSSAHHSPIPQSVQFPKKVYPPTNTRPSSPVSRDYSNSAGATPTTAPGVFSRTNGHLPPTPSMQEVHFDAVQRLQVQVSHQQGGLQSQRRSVDMLEAKVDTQQRNFDALTQDVIKLAEQMSRIENVLYATRQELHARPTAPAAVPPVASQSVSHLDDGVLEAFATSLDHVSAKVNEVDGLKMQLEILKRRIRMLESQGREPGPAPATTHLPPTSAAASSYGSREALPPPQVQHHPQSTQPHPPAGYNGSQALDATAKEPHPESRLASQASSHAPSQPYNPHAVLPPQHVHQTSGVSQTNQHSSGWVPVNQGAKRQLPNGVDGSPDTRPASTGSPKRPKLAPLEPRLGPESGGSFDRMEVDGNEQRNAALPSHESAFHPISTPSSFVPFGHMVDSPAEAWHADPRSTMSATRDVPRRGRGGRGRGRKSLPTSTRAVGTPEWDKPPMDWTGSQVVREGYYSLEGTPSGSKMPRGNNLMRRGSGGGGPLAMRPVELVRPSTACSELDPYAHTKKTRTKPFRNAQGILIRKDGLPDMRSHSSAANLRKVHARKEQERTSDIGKGSYSPTSGHDGMSTPMLLSSNGSNTPEAEHATEADRHNAIMRKMFPNGIGDQASQHNYHDKFFPSRSAGHAAGPQIKHEAHSPTMLSTDTAERAGGEARTNGEGQNGNPQVNGAQANVDSEEARMAPQHHEPVAVAQAA